MTEAWIVVGLVGAATVALKSVGPVVLGGRPLPDHLTGVVSLLAPALLAALVVTQVVGGDREIVLDARLVGLAAAVVALLCGRRSWSSSWRRPRPRRSSGSSPSTTPLNAATAIPRGRLGSYLDRASASTRNYRRACRDPLRAQRRRQHRLPGRRRRSVRPRLRPRVRDAPGAPVEDPKLRAVPGRACVLLSPDPVRQARHRPLRPGQRHPHPRGAHGRRARGHGCSRLPTRGVLWAIGGSGHEHPVRRDLSGANGGTRGAKRVSPQQVGARLPMGSQRRRLRARRRSGVAGVRPARSRRASPCVHSASSPTRRPTRSSR